MSRPSRSRPGLPELPSLDFPADATPDAVYAANEALAPIFAKELRARAGAEARTHLALDRALPEWLVTEVGVGYVPEGAYSIRDAGVRLGLSMELLVAAGLCKRAAGVVAREFRRVTQRDPETPSEFAAFFQTHCRDQPEYYRDYHMLKPVIDGRDPEPLFGNWLALPIHVSAEDGRARIGGFQLRSCYPSTVIGKGERYRNPIKTIALSWMDTVIGLATEREQIARSGRVIVVEGVFDRYATMLAVRDLDDAVRPGVVALGGAMTRGTASAQDATDAGVLRHLVEAGARDIVLCTDMDDTGTKANLDTAPRLLAAGATVHVCRLTDAPGYSTTQTPVKDPGELVRSLGASALGAALSAAQSRDIVRFAVEYVSELLPTGRTAGTLWHRLKAFDRVRPMLTVLPASERAALTNALEDVLALPAPVLAVGADKGAPAATARRGGAPTRSSRVAATAPVTGTAVATTSAPTGPVARATPRGV